MFKNNIIPIILSVLYALFIIIFLVVYKLNSRKDKGLKLWIAGNTLQLISSIFFIFRDYLPASVPKDILTFIFNVILIVAMYIIIKSTLEIIGTKPNKIVMNVLTSITLMILTYATIINYNAGIIVLVFLLILTFQSILFIFVSIYKKTTEQKSRWFAFRFIQAVAILVFLIFMIEKIFIYDYSLADILLYDDRNLLVQGVITLGISNALGLSTAVNNYTPTFKDLEESVFIKIFDNSPNITVMFNVNTLEINFFNEKFLKTFGYRRFEVINKMKIENLFTDKEDYKYFINKIDNNNNINFDVVKLKTKSNTFIYASFAATPFNLQEGKYFIINIVNITNSVTKQQKYQKLASIDELTSLPNRRNYIEKFDEKVLNKEEFSVILLDLDGFKSINDTYGHNIGDDALIAISRRLMAYNDNENIIARIGGDEFAMLIKNDQSNRCNLKLNDITNTFNEPIILGNIQIKVTYSAGVSFYPKDGRNLRVLFDKADIALYKAKEYEESKLFEYSDLIKK